MNGWKVSTFVLGAALAGILAFGSIGPAQAAAQPNMKAGLELLKQAKDKLKAATSDKGGHRVKALGHVDQAIDEVKAGIEFDEKN